MKTSSASSLSLASTLPLASACTNEDQRFADAAQGDCSRCAAPSLLRSLNVCAGGRQWRISMRCAQIFHKFHSILIKRKTNEPESGRAEERESGREREERSERTLRKSAYYARLVINLGMPSRWKKSKKPNGQQKEII